MTGKYRKGVEKLARIGDQRPTKKESNFICRSRSFCETVCSGIKESVTKNIQESKFIFYFK